MSLEPWQWLDEVLSEETTTGLDHATIRVCSEVPVTKEQERLPRRGNRYYPTMIALQLNDEVWGRGSHVYDPGEPRETLMMASDARAIAYALLRAVTLAEATDNADSDSCGHWYPCHSCRLS